MVLCLHLPDSFELIEIVLTVERLILQAIMRIGFDVLQDILTDGLLVEIEFLGAVADGSEIAAAIVDGSVNVGNNESQLLLRKLPLKRFYMPSVLLQATFCPFVLSSIDAILGQEDAGGLRL